MPASARSLAKSHILDRHLTIAECHRIVELFRKSPNGDNFIGFEAYGGAINAVAPDATAFWHRSATTDVFLFTFWMYENDHKDAVAFLGQFDDVVKPLANGHAYQNYPNRDIDDFGKVYFGGNLDRLREVKERYDPDDLFFFQQSLSRA